MAALASFLKADNFEGKARFVSYFEGLEFISREIVLTHTTDQLRLKKSIFALMNDLIVNDEGIIPEAPTSVRTYFAGRDDVLSVLLAILSEANL